MLSCGWAGSNSNQVLERTRVRNLSQKSGKGFRAKTVGPSFSPVAIAAARTTPLSPPFPQSANSYSAGASKDLFEERFSLTSSAST